MKTKLPILFLFIAFSNLFAQKNDTLSLLFIGDIMNNQAMIDAACIEKNKKYDYNPNFKYIKPTIAAADIAIGNLELTMPGKPPYTGFPHFRSPDAVADALKNAGFDVLVTANNHSNDSGAKGVKHTIEVLDQKKLLHTGTFKNKTEREEHFPLILEKKGFKIALLNYTHHTNGIATQKPVVVNRLNGKQLKADMQLAKALKPDFIIVFLHWGEEYQLKENTIQRRLAKTLVSLGANLIIGAHPHVVQPIKNEVVTLKNGQKKSALVAYSLGNFISNMSKPNSDGGILLEVTLVKSKKKTTQASIAKWAYIPIWRYIQKTKTGKLKYYVLPIDRLKSDPKLVSGMSVASHRKMLKFGADLRKRLK
jgi:poly-gamma-glutamate capsule biosynthesis protein CapA/YwtB (metallophosphatase superfamily)